jgi:8-oxo-dGTP diphosphatase
VCGVYIEDNKILLVNHKGLTNTGNFWAPPGGGMHFGESATENLEREFLEETGLKIKVGKFLFINEYISKPLHAIEIFFQVQRLSGILAHGNDPELGEQIIKEVKFKSLPQIKSYSTHEVHSLFYNCHSLQDILQMNGYICEHTHG